MTLEIIALTDLLESENTNNLLVQKILDSFQSIRVTGSDEAHDVESFIKKNAILFNRTGIASTHLIFSSYKKKPILVAYFTIANKELCIPKKSLQKLSKTLQKKVKQRAIFVEETSVYKISAFLIGQLGKNYTTEALRACNINGADILDAALNIVLNAKRIVGGSFVWVEYENNEKLRSLYKEYGFVEIPDFVSPNKLKLAIKQIK